MATYAEINDKWRNARAAYQGSDAEFLATPQGQAIKNEMVGYYSNLSDPNEIASQLDYQRGRLTDPVYGASAGEYAQALLSRQQALAPRPAATGMGGGGAATGPAPAPVPRPNYGEGRASVEQRIAGMLSSDSPLLRQAKSAATESYAARGLRNSARAEEAGLSAVVRTALPIAQQDAAQVHQGQLQGEQLGSTERLATQEQASARERLIIELGSRERLAAAEAALQRQLQGEKLNREDANLVRELEAADARLTRQITADDTRSTAQIQAEGGRATRAGVAEAITSVNNTYTQAVNALTANPDIPAETRNAMLASFAATRDANLKLIEIIYGVTLNWSKIVEAVRP